MIYEQPKLEVLTLDIINIIRTSGGMTEWDDADQDITPSRSVYNWTK